MNNFLEKKFNWQKTYHWLLNQRTRSSNVDGITEKLPSIGLIVQTLRVSKTTALRALEQLERDGLIYSKERVGYFFQTIAPSTNVYPSHNLSLSSEDEISSLLTYNQKEGVLNYSNALLDTSLIPHSYIRKCLRAMTYGNSSFEEELLPTAGLLTLRKRLVSLMSARKISCNADDIVITVGDTPSLGDIINCVLKPNQKILVVVPCYYGILQFIKDNGIAAISIPLANTGDVLDLDLFETFLKQEDIGIVYINPTLHNPTGQTLVDHVRDGIYQLSKKYQIPILEDDIFYDLMETDKKPLPIKARDQDELVIYFSSFSKVFSPGFCVGWCLPGKYKKDLLNNQLLNNSAASSISQKVLDEYLKKGYYSQHMEYLKSIFHHNTSILKKIIAKQSKDIIEYSAPTAGFIHWLKLGCHFDMLGFKQYCLEKNIFMPSGNIFFLDEGFEYNIRLCLGLKLTKADIANIETIIKGIGLYSHHV